MLLTSEHAGFQDILLLLDFHCCLFAPGIQLFMAHFQVLTMNQAFAEERRGISTMDTSSRHLLGQRQNATAAPWNVARAGHQVSSALLCQARSSMPHVFFQFRFTVS